MEQVTAHFDPASYTLILCLVDETDTYTETIQQEYFNNVLSVRRAFVASLRLVQGFPDTIDPDKSPRNYKDAMSSPDNQEWAEAYQKKIQGFNERRVFTTIRPPKGAKILETTTPLDYKIDDGALD